MIPVKSAEFLKAVAMNQQWAFPGIVKNRFDTACKRSNTLEVLRSRDCASCAAQLV
jgi:hypothetical protein